MSHPQARRFEHVRELDGELIIVDEVHDVAHRLTAQTASVWRACDGTSSGAQLAAAAGVDRATADAAVDELRALCLLEDAGPASLDTRRSMLRKAVLTGAAAGVGGSLVSSVLLPTPAQAYDSQPGGPQQSPSDQGAPPPDGENGSAPMAAEPQAPAHHTTKHHTTKHKKKHHKKKHHKKKRHHHTAPHHSKHHAKHHAKHHKKKRHAKAHRRKRRHG